nr:MAG TPA: hypothetical protein [Inoviridae sp.]
MARLTRKVLEHEKMDTAVALLEVTSADDQEKMIAYRFYYGRINAFLDYLDGKAQDIPPIA